MAFYVKCKSVGLEIVNAKIYSKSPIMACGHNEMFDIFSKTKNERLGIRIERVVDHFDGMMDDGEDSF
jgi:hypothetical protein